MDAHHARWSDLLVVGLAPRFGAHAARAAAAAGRPLLLVVAGTAGSWLITLDPADDELCWLEPHSG